MTKQKLLWKLQHRRAGGKYGKALTKDVMYKKELGKWGSGAAELAGDKAVGNSIGKMMENRPGSAKNELKATEAQRQQVQQQHLKMLNGGSHD